MKSSCLIAAVVVACLVLGAVPAGAQKTRRSLLNRGQTVKRPEPPVHKPVASHTTDLRRIISELGQTKSLVEGRNLVYTSSNGTKLYLLRRNGKTVAWEATSKNGSSLPVHYRQDKQGQAGQAQPVAAESITCKVCVDVTVEGKFLTVECYEIPCTDLPKPINRQ